MAKTVNPTYGRNGTIEPGIIASQHTTISENKGVIVFGYLHVMRLLSGTI